MFNKLQAQDNVLSSLTYFGCLFLTLRIILPSHKAISASYQAIYNYMIQSRLDSYPHTEDNIIATMFKLIVPLLPLIVRMICGFFFFGFGYKCVTRLCDIMDTFPKPAQIVMYMCAWLCITGRSSR